MENRFYLVQTKDGKVLKYTTKKDADSMGVIIASYCTLTLMVNYFCNKIDYYSFCQAQRVCIEALKNKMSLGIEDWLEV